MYAEFTPKNVFSITTLPAGYLLQVTNILFTQRAAITKNKDLNKLKSFE